MLVLLSLSQYSFDFIFHITDLASTISINSSITSCVHTFSFGSHPANSAFPALFTMCFLFGKQNCIIPKLNSDWQIPIKVHPSFKKNRMRFYSIKVLQSFWSKFSFEGYFDQENLVKENFDSHNRPYNTLTMPAIYSDCKCTHL